MRIKNQYVCLILVAICLGFTSCFEIIEEVSMNEDGSGHFEFTLNMSQSSKKLNSIRQLDSFSNYHVPTEVEINREIERGLAIFRSTKGLHNVKVNRDYEKYIFTINLDFDSIAQLNKAVKRTVHSMSGRPLGFLAAYEWDGKSLTRISNWHASGAFKDLNRQNRKIFETSQYITIARLPKEVDAVSNGMAKISGNKKATFLRANLLELVDGNHSLANEIALKNP